MNESENTGFLLKFVSMVEQVQDQKIELPFDDTNSYYYASMIGEL